MRQNQGFTLIEMLLVVGVAMMLAVITGDLAVNAYRATKLSEQRAAMNRYVPSLQRAWQNALAKTDPVTWSMDGNHLVATGLRIEHEGTDLVFQSESVRKRFPLPSILETSIHIERNPDSADCAVINLHWESRWLSAVTTNNVRLVACGRSRNHAQ